MATVYSTPSLVAVATGIVGSAWASGTIAGMSLASIPAIRSAPQTSAQTWAVLFHHGKAIMPKIAAVVALSYAYAGWDARQRGTDAWKGWLASAALTVSTVPFTLLAMNPTNEALLTAASRGVAGTAAKGVDELLSRWATLNLARSSLPLAAAAVGFWTFWTQV